HRLAARALALKSSSSAGCFHWRHSATPVRWAWSASSAGSTWSRMKALSRSIMSCALGECAKSMAKLQAAGYVGCVCPGSLGIHTHESTELFEFNYIHRVNLNKLDLNLFLVFDTIYHEGSLTQAALKHNLSQPAVS